METSAAKAIRPTKRQRELLTFVDEFVAQHGYGPSYREIMTGCNYTSVATVALHVNSLISRGHMRKKERSARSLEVIKDSITDSAQAGKIQTTEIKDSEEKWLVEKIDYKFRQCENSKNVSEVEVDGLYVLVGSLKVLGLEGDAQSFMTRLSELKKQIA